MLNASEISYPNEQYVALVSSPGIFLGFGFVPPAKLGFAAERRGPVPGSA
ncbi:hypothetical protein EJ06DRAFT_584202 [Trichodelitschia bisporula]|uniref:Uncharacterized protein n=1 Tax=Trichodelitschia bisporula TaxID=703511 RepID=A0A6G1HPJ4_9PEZI|nr:hypothetical protein EJ06DRAFT_584202 [Trichodelitschia bisporula]